MEDYERIVAADASPHPMMVARRRRLVHGRLPRGQPAEGGPGRRRPRPSRLPDEPGRPQRVGELASVRDRRPDRGDAGPRRRVDRPRRNRRTRGHRARGSVPLDRATRPRPRRYPIWSRGCASHSATCIRWGSRPGRMRVGQLPDVRRARAARRVGRAHRPRGRRAVVGPPPGDRTGERPARGPRARSDRAVRGHDRQDHAGRRGREPYGRRPRAVPGRRWPADAEPRNVVRRGRGSESRGHAPGSPKASRSTSTRSASGRSARRWTRSRPRERRTARATIAITSRTSRSCTPTTSRASESLTWSRTLSRCGR